MKIPLDGYRFRTFLIPAGVNAGQQIIGTACLLQHIFVSSLSGGGTYVFSLYDGSNAIGTLLHQATQSGSSALGLSLTDLRIEVDNGLFFTMTGAAPTIAYTIVFGTPD